MKGKEFVMNHLYKKGYKGYLGYKKALNKKINMLKKHKVSKFALPKAMTFEEWQADYIATKNTFQQEVEEGKRKVIGNISQEIIKRQVYTYSQKQGRAMRKASMETGQAKLTMDQIRTGDFDWSEIKEYYRALSDAGVSSYDIQDLIGYYFFGSD